jgi:hypothetical protein
MKYELDDDNRKNTHLDYQFVVAVCLRDESKTHLYSDWGGIEFGNSWKAGIEHAKEIVKKHPDYLCVVIDRLNRKKPLEITHETV